MASQRKYDRVAEMSKQEELIAKKRQEILEKQKTKNLAQQVIQQQKAQEARKTSEQVAVAVESKDEKEEEDEEKEYKEVAAAVQNSKSSNSIKGLTGKLSFGLKRSLPKPQLMTEEPAPKIQNNFCNDGSFLENFKKILEQQQKQQEQQKKLAAQIGNQDATATSSTANPTTALSDSNVNSNASDAVGKSEELSNTSQQEPVSVTPSQIPPSAQVIPVTTMPSLPVPPPAAPHFPYTPQNFMPQNLAQPPQVALAAYFGPHFTMQAVAPPPPPPPPQLPINLANIGPMYMIPAPELSTIQAPKEFDLTAIPKPQLNLEAIQVPIVATTPATTAAPPDQPLQQEHPLQAQQQNHLQPQQETQCDPNHMNSITNVQLPTTIEKLIEMVADYGDDYENEIRSIAANNKNQLHPALWFIFDKNCEQYNHYREQLNIECERREDQRFHEEQQQMLQQQQQSDESLEDEQQQQEQPTQLNLGQPPDFCMKTEESSDEENNDYEENEQKPGCSNAFPIKMEEQQNIKTENHDKYDPEMALGSADEADSDDEYMRGLMDRNRDNIKRRIECRNELSEEERQANIKDEEDERLRQEERKRKRKSRWGEKIDESSGGSSNNNKPSTSLTFGNQNKPMLSTLQRTDPGLLQYARNNYGSTDLNEDEWQKCEEHYKVNLLYQDMMRKRQEIDRLARSGKFKYEYDSDEDVDGGTWEHKLRTAEMEATQAWSQALTKQSEGKHHIGDFLPPEELKKFMEQYEAKKQNRQPDLSDYKEYKLKEDNIGFQMLQKLGWKEGQGLGTDGAGIVDPINKGPKREGNMGLGVASGAAPENNDNEYDAYRKRMMLAYRFRPNPLNNPRRAYY